MSVPNINAIRGLTSPNLGCILPVTNNSTASTFITAQTFPLTNVLPQEARPNTSRMTANMGIGPAALNVFSFNSVENGKNKISGFINDYYKSRKLYLDEYQCLIDLQQQHPVLEAIPAHQAQIKDCLDRLFAAAQAVRSTAAQLEARTGDKQIARYSRKWGIDEQEANSLKEMHKDASTLLFATQDINAFRNQELQATQEHFYAQHVRELDPFLTELSGLLFKIQDSASSGEEVMNASARIGELKEVIDQRIKDTLEFKDNAKLQTDIDWSSLQDNVDARASEAQLYAQAHREMLASFDIETFQWDKAKKDLLSLPNEIADDRKLKISASQYKLYSFGFDAGRYVFSHCLKPALKEKFKGKWGEQALDLVDSGLQIAAEPLIKEFIGTQLIDYPDVFSAGMQGNSISIGPVLSGVSFACTAAKMGMKPALDLFVKDQASRKWWKESIERPISVMLDVTGTGARALLPFQMGTGWPTAGTLAGNLVIVLAPPALSMFESCMGDNVGHDFRAVLRTANKVVSDLPLISLICQGGDIASSYAKGALINYGVKHLGTSIIGSGLLKGAAYLTSPVVVIGLPAIYRTFTDYPNIRTVTLLEEIRNQHAANNSRKVEELRQEAQNWWIGNSQAISHYNNCLGLLRFEPGRMTISENDRLELNRLIPSVNDALTSLVPTQPYSGIRNDLLYRKVACYLSVDNYVQAKNSLANEKIDPQLYAQLISFIIFKADSLARQDFDSAERFLNGAKEIFRDPAYNNIVAKYKDCTAERRRLPQLTLNSSLNETYPWRRSIETVRSLVNQIPALAQINEYLQSNIINQYLNMERYGVIADLLKTFDNAELGRKYRDIQELLYHDLTQTPQPATIPRLNGLRWDVDDVLGSLKSKEKYAAIRRDLLYHKIAFPLSVDHPDSYTLVKNILSNEERDPLLYARLIYSIISRANSLASQNFDNAERFLERSKNIFPTSTHNDVVAKYKAYIAQKRNPQLTAASTDAEINTWLQAIDNVRLSVNSISELAELNEQFQRNMVNQFLNLQKYDELATQMGRFGDTEVETKYRAIQDFLRHNSIPVASPETITRMRGLLSRVSQAQEALFPMKKYLAVWYDSMYHDLAFLLSIDQFAGVRSVLSGGGLEPQLYHRMLEFIVRRAEVLASTNLDTAEQFIDGVREIFPSPAHNSIIEKYKDHIAVRKRIPRLTTASSENDITAWSQSLEEVRSRVSQIQELAPLKEFLQRIVLNQHVDLKSYDDVANLLQSYGNPDAATTYRATRGFLQQELTQSPSGATLGQMTQLITPVDRALASLSSKDSYSEIRRELLYRKVTFPLSINNDVNHTWAKSILETERADPQLYKNLVTFIIGKANSLASSNFENAEYFLEKTRQIFRDPAYNNVVAKYKDYISIRKRIPHLTAATSENEINAWLQSIDGVRESVSQIPELVWIGKSLQSNLINEFLSLQKYAQVADLFVRFGDANVGEKYRSVQDFLGRNSIQTPSEATRLQINGLLPNVNQTLEALKPLERFKGVRIDLLYRKVAFLLSVDNYTEARAILSNEEQSPELYAGLANFMINRANSFAPEHFDSAQSFLERAKEIFATPTYKNIISTYKEYRSCIKNNDRALPQITDDLIAQIVRIKEMSWLHEHLLVSKFEQYVHARQYTQAKTTLALPQISESAQARAKKWLSHHLMYEGERLLASNSAEKVYRELYPVASACDIRDDSTVKSYLQALVCLAQPESENDAIENFKKAIQAIDKIGTEDPLLLQSFKRRKSDYYSFIGNLYCKEGHYPNALQAYKAAKELLLTEVRQDRNLIKRVDGLIQSVNQQLNRYNYEYKTN